jgi:hypothetical protein
VGKAPVWGGFYGHWDASGALHLFRPFQRTASGWRDKVLWLVAHDQRRVIRLHGHNLKTGAPVRFDVELSGEGIKTVGFLNHGKPGAVSGTGEPREFPSFLYFPRAGCYALSARWSGGQWGMVLGFGR